MGQFNAAYMRARRDVEWQLAFAWLPHRCELTGRRIWLEYAYYSKFLYTGPGDPIYEVTWHDRHEHLMWTLKGYSFSVR